MADSDEIATLKTLLESDIATLYGLVNTFGVPVAEGNIRAASVILRKWLTDGLLGNLCRKLDIEPSFPVIDNSDALSAATALPGMSYFLTAGVMCAGVPIMFVCSSSTPWEVPAELSSPKQVLVKLGPFIDQKRAYFRGEYFKCGEIITYTANKLGGAHWDTPKNERHQRMHQAATFMTFGGPLENIQRPSKSELHLAIEEKGREMMSGFHLEIIAAAASFIRIHMNGEPFALLPRTKRSLLSRLLNRQKPRFRLYERND